MIDFSLNLIEAASGMEVHASAGPGGALGEASQFLQPQDVADLERIRQQAESVSCTASLEWAGRDLARTGGQHQRREEVNQTLKQLGKELFGIVVRDGVRVIFERARLATLEGREDVLLVLIKLRALSPLQAVPWELLHDGDRFLAKDPRSAVVRYFEQTAPVGNLEVEPPLRVLVTSASHKDLPPLALTEEEAAIRAAYEKADSPVDIVVESNVSLGKLEEVWRQAGNEGKPFHVWHHCGHGGQKDDAGQEGFVLWLKGEGRNCIVDIEQLQEIVGFCPVLRIAVFNVCRGGSSAGIVPALARLNVPVVVGFQQAVRDPAAVRFAAVLHESLLHVPIELAVSQARSSLEVNRCSFDWIHALAFSRRRDRGLLISKPISPPRPRRPVIFVALLTLITIAAIVVLMQIPNFTEQRWRAGRTDLPSVVLTTLNSQKAGNRRNSETGASVEIQQPTLLPDGRLEVRGEVLLANRSDQQTMREYLRSLRVQVTLDDGAEGEAMIDAKRGTWTVPLRLGRHPRPGDSLEVKAFLFGDGGSELDRTSRTILVKPPGPSS